MTDKVINRLKNLKKSKLRKNFKNPFEETGKPDAARGKTTRKGRIKKIAKSLIKGVKPKVSMKTNAKRMRTMLERKLGQKPTPQARRGLSSMIKALPKGAGMTGGAMTIQAMREAKKRKPTGRVNMDDIRRVKQMMSKRKGK